MEVPRHWRLQKQRYALVGEICPHCNTPIFPARDICPYCNGDTKQAPLSEQHKVSFSSFNTAHLRVKPQASLPRS
jgi:uncharacterized OB-fold protein